MTTEQLHITDLTAEGLGIARRADGKVIMLSNALPGEVARVKIIEDRKNFALGQTLEIIRPAAERTMPLCPWFGRCGGCDLQHLAYAAQLKIKAKWLAQALRGLSPLPEITVIPSPLPYGYRRRLRLHAQPDAGLGFHARRSHDLIVVDNCPLASDYARGLWPALRQIDLPGLEEAEILAGDHQLYLRLTGRKLRPRKLDLPPGVMVQWPGQTMDFSQGMIYYQSRNLILKTFTGQFSQINWLVNARLIECLQALARPFINANPFVLDLFAGSGNLSLPLAQAGAQVWAVEGNPQACQTGQAQARANRLECRFINSAVHKFLNQGSIPVPGLLLLDPPRQGVKGLIAALAALRAPAVTYISCHPAALARDAAVLAQSGYQLQKLFLFDMFCQTGQMECLALMLKIAP